MHVPRDPHDPARRSGPDGPPDAVAHATGVAFSGAPARPARAFAVLVLAVAALVVPGMRAEAEAVMPTQATGALNFAFQQVGETAGTEGPDRVDGAGLARRAYATVGVLLPRTPAGQWRSGPRVARGDWQPGDLVFWADDPARPGSTVTDVALYLGGGQALHVPRRGAVQVAPLTTTGLLAQAVRPAGLDATPLLDVSAETHGDAVRDVQHRLRANGWDVAVTGTYDAGTRAGVAEFQRRVGLPGDGVVRHATWAQLVRRGAPAAG